MAWKKSVHIALITLFMLGTCMLVYAQDSPAGSLADAGLEKKVTISADKTPLGEFLNQLSDATRLSIVYSNTLTDPYTVTIVNKEYTVREVLELILRETKLTFRIEGRSIMILVKKNISAADATLNKETPSSVTGKVIDKTGTPMPGVSIYLKGTNTGTTTDAEGNFMIDLPAEVLTTAGAEPVIVFSFIGYKKVEEPVGVRTTINLTMQDDANILDEVVIKGGYYETTDKLKTGSIVKITAKEIENQPVTSPLMALQGRVTGLDITPNSGTPGNAPVIRIRGNNSLRMGSDDGNGNYPLYVIDGVPVSSVPIRSLTGFHDLSYGGYDPLSTINPSNIASIEVLKDGDATAIYGSRGANGVILITTKRNTKSVEHTNFDFKVSTGVGRVTNRVDLLNTPQYLEMRQEGRKNDGLPLNGLYYPDLVYWDTTRYTDWQDVFFGGTSSIIDIQGGVSGGNKNTSYSFGLGHHKETLVTPGDFAYNRGTANLSINHTSNNNKFRASFAVNFGRDQSDMFGGQFILTAVTLPPNAPELYDENGDLNWEMHPITGSGILYPTWDNPMASLEGKRKAVSRNVITSGNLSYEVLPGVSLTANIGLSDLVNNEVTTGPISAAKPFPGNTNYGSSNFVDVKRTSWIFEPKASLFKKWGEHQLDFLIGSTWQQNMAWNDIIIAEDYVSDALLESLKGAGKTTIIQNDVTEYKYTSLYSRAGYNYAQKYLLNLTVRRDGSSRFGPDSRFGTFWSVGSAWIFSGENFLKNTFPALSFGKLRVSYGLTGSDAIGDYGYYNLYDINTSRYQGIPGFVPAALYNPDYAWEETSKLEGAIELAFIDGRISTEISWYRNRSSNQLVQYPLANTTGFDFVLQNFEATVQNRGLEILLRSNVIDSENLNWNISFNISFAENKLVEFDGIEDSPYANQYKVGKSTQVRFLYTYKGLNPETGLYEVVDKNNDGKYTDLDKSLSSPLDKTPYGGILNTVRYKSLELSFNFYFAKRDVERFYWVAPGAPSNQPASVLNHWQKPGDITEIQMYGTGEAPAAYERMRLSDFNKVDGSFVRLKTLSIAYSLPAQWMEQTKLQQARLFIEAQNLFTITRYAAGLDPETGPTSLPPLQMITIGLQLKL